MSTQQLVERLQRLSSAGGGWVLWLMLFLSVVSLAVALERFVFFARRRGQVDELSREVLRALRRGDDAHVASLFRDSKSIVGDVFAEAADALRDGPESFREAVEAEWVRARKRLNAGMTFLGTLGNNAPFIGLLGTVLGVIQAFRQLGQNNQDGMGNVMAGIAEALIATGVGLFVALPAVVAYNVLSKKIDDIESDVTWLAKRIVALLSRPGREAEEEQRNSDTFESAADEKAVGAAE